MGELARFITVIMVGLFVNYFLSNYLFYQYQHNDVVYALTESVKISSVKNTDNYSRVEEGSLHLNKDDFERDVKDQFKKDCNINLKNTKIAFDYLQDKNLIKAIKIKVTDDKGFNYRTSYITNYTN